jgi:hypothetical protein
MRRGYHVASILNSKKSEESEVTERIKNEMQIPD